MANFKNANDLADSLEHEYQPSALTNIKVLKSRNYHDFDDDKDYTQSMVEYVPYADRNVLNPRKLYATIRGYNNEPIWDKGAIVAVSPELAEKDYDAQYELGVRGADRYLGRGKYDEDFFNIIRDNREEGDDQKYKELYGWDFNKPFKEHDFIKDDPWLKLGVK